MRVFTRIFFAASPTERHRFVTIAIILFIQAFVVDSNEIVATSGFVSNIGAVDILWVWAADMLVVIFASGIYSLIVDRIRREYLAFRLLVGFGVADLLLFLLFVLHVPDVLAYPLITIVNDQQWIILPLVVWALANDTFSVAQGKQLFPILGVVGIGGGILGSIVGSASAELLAHAFLGSIELLLINAFLLFVGCAFLAVRLPTWKSTVRQARAHEGVWENFREGFKFVHSVPSFRYLSLAMVLLGIALTVVEFQFMLAVAQTFTDPVALQAFYGGFRVVVLGSLSVIQIAVTGWLISHVGLKSIFFAMPVALLFGTLLILFWPNVLAPICGSYLARISLVGVDEPARHDLQGLIPDEYRGRVGAFMDGYLYPIGTLLACVVLEAMLFTVHAHVIAEHLGRLLTVGLGVICAGGGLVAVVLCRRHYDKSMLNWRLKRRPRGKVLDVLNF